MKLANVRGRACAVVGGRVLDLNKHSGGSLPADPMAYMDVDVRTRAQTVLDGAADAAFETPRAADFGPPVPRPPKILAVALNFRAHAAESHQEVPAEPSVFGKLTSSLCGPYDAIEVAPGCDMVDYEAEVVVVVGRTMRGVAAEDVWDHVAGITAGQDISDRFEQRRPPLGQFSLAKSYDSFSPIGPVLATLDEFVEVDRITVSGRLAQLEVQHGSTDQLIHSVPQLLAWTCRYVTLEPGDLIFTGTPEGVGSRREPPLYLTPGMVLETEIPEVGVMRNPIVAAPAPPRSTPAVQLTVEVAP